MKKNITLFVLMMAMAMMSCHHNNKPTTDPKPETKPSEVSYDLAVMDEGQLVLFDIANKTAVPIEEEDSIFNLTFTPDNRVYYTVKEDNNTFIKYVSLEDPDLIPTMADTWGIPYDCCVGTAYYCLKAPALVYYPEHNILGMRYMHEPNYGYDSFAVFDLDDGVACDYEEYDEDLMDILNNPDYKDPFAETFINSEEEGQLYYKNGEQLVCLTDQLDMTGFEPEEGMMPFYRIISADPTNRFVLFQTYTNIGDDDESHGPQCVASLDGKVQKVLGDFDESYPGQWLPDGSLVYASNSINLLTPDGKEEVLYPGTCFVLRQGK